MKLQFEGESFSVQFRPGPPTTDEIRSFYVTYRYGLRNATIDLLLGRLTSWDLTLGTMPLSITEEGLRLLPTSLLIAMCDALFEHIKETTPPPSSDLDETIYNNLPNVLQSEQAVPSLGADPAQEALPMETQTAPATQTLTAEQRKFLDAYAEGLDSTTVTQQFLHGICVGLAAALENGSDPDDFYTVVLATFTK